MDMRIEAAPAVATAEMLEATVVIVPVVERELTNMVARVVSFSCPTLGSHSISAVAPDAFFERTLANAA